MSSEPTESRLEGRIRVAFAGVSRSGGVSWRGAQIADFYGDEEYADYVDRDSVWEDLLEDPDWKPWSGTGGFSFLDAVGFRYYLAPAMVRAVRSPPESDFAYSLLPGKFRVGAYNLKQWSLLSDEQRSCVADFLRFLVQDALSRGDDFDAREFGRALERYWGQF